MILIILWNSVLCRSISFRLKHGSRHDCRVIRLYSIDTVCLLRTLAVTRCYIKRLNDNITSNFTYHRYFRLNALTLYIPRNQSVRVLVKNIKVQNTVKCLNSALYTLTRYPDAYAIATQFPISDKIRSPMKWYRSYTRRAMNTAGCYNCYYYYDVTVSGVCERTQ